MIEVFENIINMYSNESITTTTILSVLLMVTILAIYEFFVYRFISHRSFYNKSFNITIVTLPFFISTIILCLQSNIIITLGTIGALAIIRFRTAIKDPKDTMFIFWAISEGLSTGSGNFLLSLVTTLFIAIIIISLEYLIHKKNKYIVVVTGGKETINLEDVEFILSSFSSNKKLRCANKNDNHQEYIYEIKSINDIDSEFLSKIKDVKGVKTANFLLETGESIG